ncbi:hypothetical protein, conserved [Plasmodium gonderi]|uniref:Uncharacterized protein n=1 Tax=Plasmodium gonderi TaxID=77519 RepID=A0A1Y1JL90_PLAGO|nr:hypothetical protein, conserved [Plasmodium gonderi]GAW81562.1 hypothetical protein, conserved [Plasmodium gonderi]
MKIILQFVFWHALIFICTCFNVDKIYKTNKTNLFLYNKKNTTHKKYKPRSVTIFNSDRNSTTISPQLNYEQNEENEAEIRKKIEAERERREQIKKENILFIKKNFQYVCNNLPINVEKKYSYETFKYSDEILAYIFFVINLFKHEQFKNKIYKEHLQNEASHGKTNWDSIQMNEPFPHPFNSNVNNNLSKRNQKLVSDFINKFGDKFKFFNSPEKIQREDWDNMFKLEQDDKKKFFKNIKIKNDKVKEYYFVIYYCNWQYECMALYNSIHNIFNNEYNNINFYNIANNVDEKQAQLGEDDEQDANHSSKKSKEEQEEIITKEDIEKIKEMYIRDMQNNEITDIDSLLSKEEDIQGNEGDNSSQENSNDSNQSPNENKQNDKNDNKPKNGDSSESKQVPEENKKKTFQELMEEEKKKLDEEFFLYGYSKYEDIEQIKKEEEMIKETKKIIKEEKSSQGKLNNEREFKNVLNDFSFHIKNYKDLYNYDTDKGEKKELLENSDVISTHTTTNDLPESLIRTNSTISQIVKEMDDKTKDSKKEVNINVIFVRLSNSTVIGKTKNIKQKIKKKWIYSHEKEIKFYELILSVMLNENIYYKDIPHMEIFSLAYEKKKLYDFFNEVNTNLKHSFIHKNNVYDIHNNVINQNMDIYNFDIYDKNTNSKSDISPENKSNTSQDEAENTNTDNIEYVQNDDVIFEELNLDDEIEDTENYKVIYDGNANEMNQNDEPLKNNTTEVSSNEEGEENNNSQSPLSKKKKKKKKNQIQYKLIKKKHNKKKISKYEALFKNRYNNIFSNTIKSKLSIQKISSISNVNEYANYTIDTFKNFSLSDIFQNMSSSQNFKIDKNYVHYLNFKIPKEIFPFILQLSLAFKYEHTTLLMNAPKKIEFEFRNV